MDKSAVFETTKGIYTGIERLAGGMSTVYRARERNGQNDFVIKIYDSDDKEFARWSYEREVETLRTLCGTEGIPKLHDHSCQNGHRFIVEECIPGKDLNQILRSNGALCATDATSTLQQICTTLTQAHAKGIVHRDLKPENIILSRKRPTLIDWGVAYKTGDGKQHPFTLGTPGYQSPEELSPEETVDCRSDIYALGLVLFELLTGRRAFDGPTEALEYQNINCPAPLPREFNPLLSEDLDEVCQKATALDPSKRYGSAEELSLALGNARKKRTSKCFKVNYFA